MSTEQQEVSESKCSICRGPRNTTGRYCRSCRASYMRNWAPKYSELSEQERKKNIARSMANVYQRRGKLKKQPCENCGSQDTQKHHEDYSKPIDVNWLCLKCHKDLHKRRNNS